MADKPLTEAMARRTCRPRREMERALDAFLAEIRERLARDGSATIRGFGKFRIGETGRRVSRDFRTGERVEAASRKVVRFAEAPTVMTGPRSAWAWDRKRPRR